MDNYFKRTWAEVNLDKLEHNFKTIRKQIAYETKLCCVIKADAYGHGALELAGLYERLGADFFAVSNLEEALELRMGGISLPILILGYTPASYAEELSKNNISQAVFSVDYAKELSKSAKELGAVVKAHIKIDTGMSRIGIMCQDIERDNALSEVMEIFGQENLAIEGIFTHFAVSDEKDEGKEY
ncbi:MAG: alanine racemase, partial [Clostridia bacterium]|nr:alanine racemase [Clostridia bacterium]